MAKVEGVETVLKALKAMAKKYGDKKDPSVTVGYTAAYALWVHENVEMKLKGQPRPSPSKGNFWDPPGAQAKFLEQPAREMRGDLSKLIRNACINGATLSQSLFLAGLALQRASQKLVPVDTGNLKGSAFTRLNK